MVLNKKAVFFTLLAIAILSLFLISYSIYYASENRKSINKRIETMNNLLFSLEKDLQRQVYIAGFRSIFIFEKKITETGSPISDVNSSFQELFFNGTLYGIQEQLMQDVRFSDIQNSLSNRARKINVEISLTEPKVYIIQENPWQIKIKLETQLFAKDRGELAFWNKTEITSAFISIENFEDPLYMINTNGLVTNKINRTNYEPFVSGTNVENLTKHLENSYYINSILAPSFLDRLEGKTNANANGIESLVYLPKLSAQGISIQDKSSVDYIYFSTNNPSANKIQNMPSWFKIDDAHLDIYQAGGLII